MSPPAASPEEPIQPWAPPPPTDTAAPPPYPGAPAPHPPLHAPAPPKKRHRGAVAVVVAVVVIVLLLVLLNYAGVLNIAGLPGSKSSPTSGGSAALSFAQAEAMGNSTVASRASPGSWQLDEAAMEEGTSPINAGIGTANPCEGTGFVPAASGSLGTGDSPYWFLVYDTLPAGPFSHEIFVVVQNNSATVEAQADPASACPGGSEFAPTTLPTNESNSPALFHLVQARGGAAFAANHTSHLEFAELGIENYGGSQLPVWNVEYESATCAVGGPSGDTYSFLSLAVEAESLGVLRHEWVNGTSCGTSSFRSYTVAFGTATPAHTLTYFDNLTLSSTGGMDAANLSLAVLASNHTLVNWATTPCIDGFGCDGEAAAGGWYALLISGGVIEASYPSDTGLGWFSTGTVALSGTMTLELISPAALAGSGDTLEAFNTNSYVVGSTML